MKVIRTYLFNRKYNNFIRPTRYPNFLIELCFDKFLNTREPKIFSCFWICYFLNSFIGKIEI